MSLNVNRPANLSPEAAQAWTRFFGTIHEIFEQLEKDQRAALRNESRKEDGTHHGSIPS